MDSEISNVGMVIKLSSSNIKVSTKFYVDVLDCTVDDRYTLTSGANNGDGSYVQLNLPGLDKHIAIGLFKDIDFPLPAFNFGTVPTFAVHDIKAVCSVLETKGIKFTPVKENISEAGYIDRYTFFNDLDNNALAIRQNVGYILPADKI